MSKQLKLNEEMFNTDYDKKMNIMIDLVNKVLDEEFSRDDCPPKIRIAENYDNYKKTNQRVGDLVTNETVFSIIMEHLGVIVTKEIHFISNKDDMKNIINKLYNVTM